MLPYRSMRRKQKSLAWARASLTESSLLFACSRRRCTPSPACLARTILAWTLNVFRDTWSCPLGASLFRARGVGACGFEDRGRQRERFRLPPTYVIIPRRARAHFNVGQPNHIPNRGPQASTRYLVSAACTARQQNITGSHLKIHFQQIFR